MSESAWLAVDEKDLPSETINPMVDYDISAQGGMDGDSYPSELDTLGQQICFEFPHLHVGLFVGVMLILETLYYLFNRCVRPLYDQMTFVSTCTAALALTLTQTVGQQICFEFTSLNIGLLVVLVGATFIHGTVEYLFNRYIRPLYDRFVVGFIKVMQVCRQNAQSIPRQRLFEFSV